MTEEKCLMLGVVATETTSHDLESCSPSGIFLHDKHVVSNALQWLGNFVFIFPPMKLRDLLAAAI